MNLSDGSCDLVSSTSIKYNDTSAPIELSPSLDHVVAPDPNNSSSLSHLIITRSGVGIHKPKPIYTNLHQSISIPQEPKITCIAIRHEGWCKAMSEELSALHANHT